MLGADAAVRDRAGGIAADAGDRADHRERGVTDVDHDVDLGRGGCSGDTDLDGDLVDADRRIADRLDGGPAHGLGRERTDGQLGFDRGVDRIAGQEPLDQALPDAPLLERVELDRDRFGEGVVSFPHVDAQALAQELAHRVLDEPHDVVERHDVEVGRLGRERRGEERRRRHARTGQSPGTGQVHPVEAPRQGGGGRRGGWLVGDRVERLQRVVDDDGRRGRDPGALAGDRGALAGDRGASLVTTAVRSITSSSSDRGTAGGRGSLERMSRPVVVRIRRSVAERSASSRSWRSSVRGSRSPTRGSRRSRSSPSARPLRGKAPSSRPRMHTTRWGTARIGTRVHIVMAPVRKSARVGMPRSRSASSARTSASDSSPAEACPSVVASATTSRSTASTCTRCQPSAGGDAISRSTAVPRTSDHSSTGRGSARRR